MYAGTEENTDHRFVKQSNSTHVIFHCFWTMTRRHMPVEVHHRKFDLLLGNVE